MKYLHGLHDPGGEHLMSDKPGWLLFTEAIGSDINNQSGIDYRPYSNYGVIARINNGYGSGGTIPLPQHYEAFARRCANFVAASPGCTRWQIGNEPNHAQERPDNQIITAEQYAECFLECRAAIKSVRPAHEVLIAAVAPWNMQTGDWLLYWRKVVYLIGTETDGYTIHIYTHGDDPALIFSDEKVNNWYWHLRVYKDLLFEIPTENRQKPVYATECNQGDNAWTDRNSGWIQNACKEIDDHNQKQSTQKIRCICFYRWPKADKYSIVDKPQVQEDFKAAVQKGYSSMTDITHIPSVGTAPTAPTVPAPATVRDWDPALYPRGVRVTSPNVPAGTAFWRFTKGRHVTDRSLGGDHHIYVDALVSGIRQVGVPFRVRWPDGSTRITTEQKSGEPYSANFPMSPGDFSIEVDDGTPSEVVSGIHMGAGVPFNPGEHTSTALVVERVITSVAPPVIAPVLTQLALRHPVQNPALRIISQRFGENPEDYAHFGIKGHNGVDFATPIGSAIVAPDFGIAIEVKEAETWGKYIKIRTSYKFDFLMAHLDSFAIVEGQSVQKGQVIGTSGNTGNSTGPHLHFGIRPDFSVRGGDFDGYEDPLKYLSEQAPELNLRQLIPAIANEMKVSQNLLKSLVWAESHNDPKAVSKAGAKGLTQLMPPTWNEWSVKVGATDIFNARDNLRVGAAYLKWCIENTDNIFQALIAYNWGIGNLKSGKNIPIETRIYAYSVVHGADLLDNQ